MPSREREERGRERERERERKRERKGVRGDGKRLTFFLLRNPSVLRNVVILSDFNVSNEDYVLRWPYDLHPYFFLIFSIFSEVFVS